MLRALRTLSRVTRLLAALALLAIAATIALAATLDTSEPGPPRTSAFALGVTLSDPFVWTCLRNGLIQAAIVATVSLVLGLPLARLLTRWRFPGRGLLAAGLILPAGLPSLFASLGLAGFWGLDAVSAEPVAELRWLEPWNWSIGGAWVAWTAAGLAAGLPLVLLLLSAPLSRTDPAWEEAGLAAGASRRRVWRTLVWPLVRPHAFRAWALVFGWTLLDPGPPLALGLRRTLPYQLVESASRAASSPADLARAGALGLVVLAVLVLTHTLVRLAGGRTAPIAAGRPDSVADRPGRRPGRRQCVWISVLGLAGAGVVWGPWISLAAAGAFTSQWPLPRAWRAPVISASLVALGVGAAAASLSLALGILWASDRPGRGRRLRQVLFAVSPLLVGLALAIGPVVLHRLADAAPRGLDHALELAARAIDPIAMPGMGAVLACALLGLHLATAVAGSVLRAHRPDWVEAAQVMGASPARAWWDIVRPRAGRPLAAVWALLASIAALDLGTAVLLLPRHGTASITPTALALADQPGTRDAAILTAAACALLGLIVRALVARPLARALLDDHAPGPLSAPSHGA